MAPLRSMMEGSVISGGGGWSVADGLVILAVVAINLVATWLLCASCCGDNTKDQMPKEDIAAFAFEEPPPEPWKEPSENPSLICSGGKQQKNKKKEKRQKRNKNDMADTSTGSLQLSAMGSFGNDPERASRTSVSDQSFLLMEEFKIYPKPKPSLSPEEITPETSVSKKSASHKSPSEKGSVVSLSVVGSFGEQQLPKKMRSRRLDETDQ